MEDRILEILKSGSAFTIPEIEEKLGLPVLGTVPLNNHKGGKK